MATTKRTSRKTRSPRKRKTVGKLRPALSDVASSQPSMPSPIPEHTALTEKEEKEAKREKPLGFLDLPAELRVNIYEDVLENCPVAKLSRNTKLRELSSTSALPRVSKLVRSEFLSVLFTRAPIIETEVHDFRFGHIIAYLNRLSTKELDKMTSANASRILRITLYLSSSTNINWEQLNRWINRAEHPTKKGATINFQYQLSAKSCGSDALGGRIDHNTKPVAIKIRAAFDRR